MACYLVVPNQYLNQWWFLINLIPKYRLKKSKLTILIYEIALWIIVCNFAPFCPAGDTFKFIKAMTRYSDVMISAMASQITGVSIVNPTSCSSADQRKYQSSSSLAFVRGICRWLVDFPHKRPVTLKIFLFDDVTMWYLSSQGWSRVTYTFGYHELLKRFLGWNVTETVRQTSDKELFLPISV